MEIERNAVFVIAIGVILAIFNEAFISGAPNWLLRIALSICLVGIILYICFGENQPHTYTQKISDKPLRYSKPMKLLTRTNKAPHRIGYIKLRELPKVELQPDGTGLITITKDNTIEQGELS